jgi:hypothetical protein
MADQTAAGPCNFLGGRETSEHRDATRVQAEPHAMRQSLLGPAPACAESLTASASAKAMSFPSANPLAMPLHISPQRCDRAPRNGLFRSRPCSMQRPKGFAPIPRNPRRNGSAGQRRRKNSANPARARGGTVSPPLTPVLAGGFIPPHAHQASSDR